MNPASFTRFIAIDWTGARGRRHKGIAVASCEAGAAAPVLVTPPEGLWSRTSVRDLLLDIAARGERALIGFDFSFAPPFVDTGAYLPGEATPAEARAFWAFVETHCGDEDLGAASFLEQAFRRHFYFGKADGVKARYMRLRACEQAFNAAGGGKPSSVFDAIGAAQVAKASFSGMRLLHQVQDRLPVWPFDPAPATGPLVVEIYGRAFIRHAGLRGLKVRDAATLDAALAALGSAPATLDGPLTDHATDALITAAGMRALAGQAAYWAPAGLEPGVARTEGWTFGVA